MKMIDSIIVSRALQQTTKLTLPNLGTLLKKDDGQIVFSQFLKNDDMVLSSIVMNSYNVSSAEANQMVSDFVVSIVSKISSGDTFLIPEVGYLYVDESNNSIKIRKEEQAPVLQQPRQPVTPKPIIGVAQQPAQPVQGISQGQVYTQTAPQNQTYPQGGQQFRQQPPFGPRPQGIPQRPQGITQRPQGIPQRPQGVAQRPQPRPQQRPQPQMGQQDPRLQAPKRKPVQKQKTDLLLLIAILVIVIIIGLIAYSMFFTETISDLM